MIAASYSVPIRVPAHDALTYCYRRLRETWPGMVAVGVTGDRYETSFLPESVQHGFDAYPVEPGEISLGHDPRPRIRVWVCNQLLEIRAVQDDTTSTVAVAAKLARHPMWVHRVSDRLSVPR
jgi:hypothetical protein